jgi:thiol-disulfide isomerase/thioredoxin
MIDPGVKQVLGWVAVVSWLGLAGTTSAQAPGAIDVKVVKYDGLKELVLKNRGKVVVVDFWFTTCPPCLKNFPHMVEMQHKYAKDGLVSVTVSTDKVRDGKGPQERIDRVLKSLRKNQSDLINVILDEDDKLIQDKLRIDTYPSVYVFGRDGKWTQFASTETTNVNPADVEKLVVDLLKK